MRRGEAKEACDSAALALLIQSQRAFLILPPLDSMRCERVSSSATVRLYIYAHARFICEELELVVKGNWKLQEEKQRGKWVSAGGRCVVKLHGEWTATHANVTCLSWPLKRVERVDV